MSLDEKETIEKLCKQGWGYKRIANELDMNPSAVRSFCLRNKDSWMIKRIPMENVCKNCGKPLYHASGRKPLFCCDACRYAWHNNQRAQGVSR